MCPRKLLPIITLLFFVIVLFETKYSTACMCNPTHPQVQFCQSEFAALIRVERRSDRTLNRRIVYKIQILRIYKATPTGYQILKHRRLISAMEDSMCGVHLEKGKLYVIAAQSPHIGICNYINEYKDMTVSERKGFARNYQRGCSCQIQPCYGASCKDIMLREPNECRWPFQDTCSNNFLACVPITYRLSHGELTRCNWKLSIWYKSCIAKFKV